ncbi:MAG: Rpn family recombination-promoting nuclease/putative transposase, partial [Alphaproteobacteria bacterium]|nr:Rpn family recombination-promoting nuclease/putative transposase [Alphaproteobacteria bacterium]
MSDHDALYHRLFSHPLMTEQLVREFAPEAMAVGLDFARMERVNAKFHDRDGKRREGDVIWRMPTIGGGDVFLYILCEFQYSVDWWMAVRTQVYEGLLWQHVIAEKKLKPGDRLPPVLMLVLYNGELRWSAP